MSFFPVANNDTRQKLHFVEHNNSTYAFYCVLIKHFPIIFILVVIYLLLFKTFFTICNIKKKKTLEGLDFHNILIFINVYF